MAFTARWSEIIEKLSRMEELERKYEHPDPPVKRDRIWHCPECNGRVRAGWQHCHRCGKRLDWRTPAA